MTTPTGPQHESGFGNLILKGIEEVVLPLKVSYFPQTVGWKILAALILLWVTYYLFRKARKWWQNRYRREALRRLQATVEERDRPVSERLAEMAELLKATALHAYPREQVAGLYGGEWLVFLNQQTAAQDYFSKKSMHLLSSSADQQQPIVTDEQVSILAGEMACWIKRHPARQQHSPAAEEPSGQESQA